MVRCLSFWMTKRIELNDSITDVGNGHLPHPFNCDYSQQDQQALPQFCNWPGFPTLTLRQEWREH